MTGRRKSLNKKFIGAALALIVAMMATAATTFAWYIYNTGAHTTTMDMVAGSASSVYISKEPDGDYTSSVSYESDPFSSDAKILIPVSTNNILKGFMRVDDYRRGDRSAGEPKYIASKFKESVGTEYYQKSLYLKSGNSDMKIYVKNIGFDRTAEGENPMSAALRVGFVVFEPKKDPQQYIFAMNPSESINDPVYNTETGKEGYVIDMEAHDGSTVPFTPYTQRNFCGFDQETGQAVDDASKDPVQIATCTSDSVPLRIDIYIWLEGCDSDCTDDILNKTVKNISIEFAGSAG